MRTAVLSAFSTVALALILASSASAAETVVLPATLPQTERGVFTTEGRYFVASALGIDEVKRVRDTRPGCRLLRALTVCRIVEPRLDGQPCVFTGMTTDGTLLYAVCTVRSAPLEVQDAALFRIVPGPSRAADVRTRRFEKPTFYNGMTVLDRRTLLLTDTSASPLVAGGLTRPAIVKLVITDPDAFRFELSDFLASSARFAAPNGITSSGRSVFFVGGQNLLRIPLRDDGSAGAPVPILEVQGNQFLDDLVVVGDRVAVAEISLVSGSGVNAITLVAQSGSGLPLRISSGAIQLSALAVDRGRLFASGDLIATSFFQGGVLRFPAALLRDPS
jgi:hypothetical protein